MARDHDPDADIQHASCVALNGRAVLILGRSGAGKSALALQLMALGAGLVADDRTSVIARDGRLFARCPETIAGMIEARGVGILRAASVEQAEIVLAVDMDKVENERLPPRRDILLKGQAIALLRRVDHALFPAALIQYLKAGRSD